MSTDEVRVVDVGVIDVFPGLHLRLQLLDHVPFLYQIVSDANAGDLVKRFRQDLAFVLMGSQRFGNHIDAHAPERGCRTGKPGEFGKLLCRGQRRRLKLLRRPARCVGRIVLHLRAGLHRVLTTAAPPKQRSQQYRAQPCRHLSHNILMKQSLCRV